MGKINTWSPIFGSKFEIWPVFFQPGDGLFLPTGSVRGSSGYRSGSAAVVTWLSYNIL